MKETKVSALQGPLLILLVVLLVCVSQGCAHLPQSGSPSLAHRKAPWDENTAIVPAQYAPAVRVDTTGWPPGDVRKLGGALLGAGGGILKGLSICAELIPRNMPTDTFGMILMAPILAVGGVCLCVVVPVCGIVGLVQGAASTPSTPSSPTAGEVAEAKARFGGALSESRLQLTMAESFLQVARERMSSRFDVRQTGGPASMLKQTDYGELAGERVGTVIELRVEEVTLSRPEVSIQRDPGILSLQLGLSVRMKIVRVDENRILREGSYAYHGGIWPFYSWIANDNGLMGEELNRGFQKIAEMISDDLSAIPDTPD